MFKPFAEKKNRYSRGQIFPFLIGLLAVLLIMVMITVNIGQIGSFKTDCANAADAGALAAASVLSQGLLELSLQSEVLFGNGVEHMIVMLIISIVAIILAIIPVIGWVAAILAIVLPQAYTFLKAFLFTLGQAKNNAKMAISNAKKTAILYALQNAGIDQPRPSFKS